MVNITPRLQGLSLTTGTGTDSTGPNAPQNDFRGANRFVYLVQ
jgi:hypothetical protein